MYIISYIAAFIAGSRVVLVTEREDATKRELIRAVSKRKGKSEHIFLVWFYFVFDFFAKHWESRLKIGDKGLLMWISAGNKPLKYNSLEYNS